MTAAGTSGAAAPESRLILGDCIEAMRQLPDCSIDAVVTDPPYGISFMGKHWDRFDIDRRVGKRDVSKLGTRLTGSPDDQAGRKATARTASAFANPAGEAGGYDFTLTGARRFQETAYEWASEWLRLLKPGGYAVVFGSTRMYHRLAAGMEDAGFEIRDTLAWMFGQGFPKSLDLAKAADRAEGHWRGRAGAVTSGNDAMGGPNYARTAKGDPITAAAAAGWGTALKPAYEPVVLARKPLEGTTLANFQKYGTGALNIDGCRILFVSEEDQAAAAAAAAAAQRATRDEGRTAYGRFENGPSSLGPYLENMDKGRWPANVLLDEYAAAILDDQSGPSSSSSSSMLLPRSPGDARGGDHGTTGVRTVRGHDDFGGASRFFYCAKVSRAERSAGVEKDGRNVHPTVKPIDLMRWLIRLVTPPGGTMLDPFLGSGSTGCAAALEGRSFIGCEREPDYMEIARARIGFWREHGEDGLRIVAERDRAEAKRAEIAATGQVDIFQLLDDEVAA